MESPERERAGEGERDGDDGRRLTFVVFKWKKILREEDSLCQNKRIS